MGYVTGNVYCECPVCAGPAKITQDFKNTRGRRSLVVRCPPPPEPSRHWTGLAAEEVTMWPTPLDGQ